MMDVYPYGGDNVTVVHERVASVANHPAILFFNVGSEWNYNYLYTYSNDLNATIDLINDAVQMVKSTGTKLPISTVFGDVPYGNIVERIPDVDMWGLNVYRYDEFGDLFQGWSTLSNKPMFLGEYGADAYDSRIDALNESAQAYLAEKLTKEIYDNSYSGSSTDASCNGGFLFEWCDEWWKSDVFQSEPSKWSQHNTDGIVNSGAYPDGKFNEEWWGLVDIDRNPREVLKVYNRTTTGSNESTTTTTTTTEGATTTTEEIEVEEKSSDAKGVLIAIVAAVSIIFLMLCCVGCVLLRGRFDLRNPLGSSPEDRIAKSPLVLEMRPVDSIPM